MTVPCRGSATKKDVQSRLASTHRRLSHGVREQKQAVLAAAIEREARAESNVERIRRDKRLQLEKRRERAKRAEAYRKTNAGNGGESVVEKKKERREGEQVRRMLLRPPPRSRGLPVHCRPLQTDQENEAPSNTTDDLFRVNPSFIANVDELVANASPVSTINLPPFPSHYCWS